MDHCTNWTNKEPEIKINKNDIESPFFSTEFTRYSLTADLGITVEKSPIEVAHVYSIDSILFNSIKKIPFEFEMQSKTIVVQLLEQNILISIHLIHIESNVSLTKNNQILQTTIGFFFIDEFN